MNSVLDDKASIHSTKLDYWLQYEILRSWPQIEKKIVCHDLETHNSNSMNYTKLISICIKHTLAWPRYEILEWVSKDN